MTGDAPREGELLLCGRCGTTYGADDDFCRRCGAPVYGAHVPALRPDYAPAVWRPPAQLVVRGAVVIAAGALAEIVLKRLLRWAFRPRSLLPVLRSRNKPPVRLVQDQAETEEPDAQIESETIVLRQVRLRRRRAVDE